MTTEVALTVYNLHLGGVKSIKKNNFPIQIRTMKTHFDQLYNQFTCHTHKSNLVASSLFQRLAISLALLHQTAFLGPHRKWSHFDLGPSLRTYVSVCEKERPGVMRLQRQQRASFEASDGPACGLQ